MSDHFRSHRWDHEQAEPDLIKGARGKPRWCHENAALILETDPAWCGVLANNELFAETQVLKPLPGSKAPRSTFRARELSDADITLALRWFNRHGFPDATRATLTEVMVAVARETVISPIRQYLEATVWDRKPRIGDWLSSYCGATSSDFVRAAGKAWLVSAVARALEPGCKADCALILEGAQGAGKSTALRVLASGQWFTDAIRDLGQKDASQGLRGKWIIELPELAAMRRSDVEVVKAYLSRDTERYRPSYGRGEVTEPRRCVFAGTTNRSDWLADDTGGRRFWPVAVGDIDLVALDRDRNQIWAEAVVAYKGGEQWWLTGEIARAASDEVALRAEDDPWTATVLAYVNGLREVALRDVLHDVGIHQADQTRMLSNRVAGILRRAGWTRRGKFTAGMNRDLARYVPAEALS